MSRVMIVEDEARYGEYLGRALKQNGLEVKVVTNAREAIQFGAHYRPDVLVTDWMLKDSIHGLHVSEALRTIDSGLQTVMITGFHSRDLKIEAQNAHVFEFLEKPFDLSSLEDAVFRALKVNADEKELGDLNVGVFELDESGALQFVNSAAKEFVSAALSEEAANSLDALFKLSARKIRKLVKKAEMRWTEVYPLASKFPHWLIRAKRGMDGRMLVLLLGEEQTYLVDHPIISMLLDLHDKQVPSWPLGGRALVIDDEEMVRQLIAAHLERIGCLCYTAATHEEGLRLFRNDSEINVVILDYVMPEGDPEQLVANIHELRSDAIIVGTSGIDRTDEFSQSGVDLFVRKPWRVNELLDLIVARTIH